jgi:hypothetical protein
LPVTVQTESSTVLRVPGTEENSSTGSVLSSLMTEWHKDRYNECDGVLEKTIRYRQVVGLLTASSIRAFCNRGLSKISEKESTFSEPISKSLPIDSIICTESSKTEDGETTNCQESSEKNSLAKTKCRGASMKSCRLRGRQLVALDVAYYLFHNNNNQRSCAKNSQQSLSSLKQSQKMNDTLLQLHHHHPGYVPVRLWQGYSAWERQLDAALVSACDDTETNLMTNTPDGMAQHSSPLPSLQFVPVCFDCGGIVQPGIQNTTIRLVRNDPPASTRAQRRRESRRKALMSQKQHQTVKLHVNHVKSSEIQNQLPHPRSKIWQYIWQQQNKYYHSRPTTDLRKLYPFMNCCKNYYIVTCGSCAAPIYLPGMSSDVVPTNTAGDRKKRGWMSKNTSAESKKVPASATKSVSMPKESMASTSKLPSVETEVRGKDNIPAASRLEASPRKRKLDDTASLPNAMSLNDRKKKKKPPKSKDLMKFLSSLNDGTG